VVINDNWLQRAKEYGGTIIVGDAPRSTVHVPILNGDQVTGIVSLQNLDREHAFTESDVRLLSTIASNMGVALENARLFEAERQRAAELAVINSVGEGLAQELTFQGIVDLVGDKIQEVFDAQIAGISLYDRTTDIIQNMYAVERGERLEPATYPLGRGFTSHVIQTRSPLVISSEQQRAQLESDVGSILSGNLEYGYPKTLIFMPIMKGEEVIGVVDIQNTDREHAFAESDVRLLQIIASSMGVALENARLFQEERQRAAELAVINSVGQALARQLDFQAVIDLVGEKVREVFRAQATYIALYDRKANLIRYPYFVGGETRHEIPPEAPGSGFTSHIIRTGESVVINDLETFRRIGPELTSLSSAMTTRWGRMPGCQ
jgi:GAF domain-containing protein